MLRLVSSPRRGPGRRSTGTKMRDADEASPTDGLDDTSVGQGGPTVY